MTELPAEVREKAARAARNKWDSAVDPMYPAHPYRPGYGVFDVLAWFRDEESALKAIEVLSTFIKAVPAEEEK